MGFLLPSGWCHAATVTNLTAFYRDGQVFLTWTNAGNAESFYHVYRSLSPITQGHQLPDCEYLGKTHKLSAIDIDLTSHYKQNNYLRIDSGGSPLSAGTGLFVATTLMDGHYYYTVIINGAGTEDTNIVMNENTLSQPVIEWVSKPKPVFQKTTLVNGTPVDIYTNFFSFKQETNTPPANEAGWLASDFLINRNNSTGNQPLLIRWHGGGLDFFAEIANTVSDAVNLHFENLLPSGSSGEYFGTNSNYNLFSKNLAIPTSGVNHNFFQQIYLHTIAWAIENLPVDSNRIYLDGSSAGACGAFAFIQSYPEKIAAAKLSVPCFNVGFENDADSICSLNTGGKNRNQIDRMLGKVSTNLPNNLGYPTFDMLNGAWTAHHFAGRSYPFVYAINGKADFVVGWTEKTIYYDSINANATGGYYFWDSRSHGGSLGFWSDDNFELFRFRRDVSYPAFSNCSLNEDYGNGSKESGEEFGTVNGALDWTDDITDTEETWSIHCFIRDLKGHSDQVVIYSDSATADISPKRLQHFNPPLNSAINWQVIHRDDTIQSGSQIYTGGVITIRNMKVFKDTVQIALSHQPAFYYYADDDQDGFGNAALPLLALTAPEGYTADSNDCNDSDSAVYPGSAEYCNMADDNCDGQVDEQVQIVYYFDADGDGFGDQNNSLSACSTPSGYVVNATDCNDDDSNVSPTGTEVCNDADDNCDGSADEFLQTIYYADTDGDGFGDLHATSLLCNAHQGFVSDSTDCNDADLNIHPAQTEFCNMQDDNCNGLTDEGAQAIFYADADGDGFGSADSVITGCPAPDGFVANHSDCNDTDLSIHPAVPETCNEQDDNCNGQADEGVQHIYFADADGDGFGDGGATSASCFAAAGYVSDSTDCNDLDSSVSPAGTETCNLADDNCNGQSDEGVQTVYFADADGDGFGDAGSTFASCMAEAGYVSDSTDCNDIDSTVSPAGVEICNLADDNCNGQADEGVQTVYFADADGDGYGVAGSTFASCMAEAGYVSDSTDCNDIDSTVSPAGVEICNLADDNCNGQADEGVQPIYFADADGDGFGDAGSTFASCMAEAGYVSDSTDCNDIDSAVSPAGVEICNLADDNCNGQADEGVQLLYYADADGDSYGDANLFTFSCTVPDGYVTDATDCADSDSLIYPGRPEACNGTDDNCNGQQDEDVISVSISPAGSISLCKGSTILLQASSAAALSYQWQKNGIDLEGATSSSFEASDAADYSVLAMTGSCSALSPIATIAINALPSANITPAEKIKVCPGVAVTFVANTGASLSHQWYNNNQEIEGATGSSYTTTLPGSYTVNISKTNGCNKVSDATTLSLYDQVNTKITITGQLNICSTGYVILNARVVNGYTYQWYRDNLPINGATSSSYTANTGGTYHYLATTTNGCAGISGSKTVKDCRISQDDVATAPLVTVFPNPVVDMMKVHVSFEVDERSWVIISLINASGQVVYMERTAVDEEFLQKDIPVGPGIVAGIYWLRLVTAHDVVNVPVSVIR